jgi:two-component system, chemotaxis family, chemotaxis protein CheY
MRILIADDSKSTRYVAKSMLKELGYKDINIVVNGQLAVKALEAARLENQRFDIVILDINMPRMTGIEVLEWIKTHRFLKNTKVIMQTTQNEVETILKAAELGADGYIIKPFTIDKLKEKLDDLK